MAHGAKAPIEPACRRFCVSSLADSRAQHVADLVFRRSHIRIPPLARGPLSPNGVDFNATLAFRADITMKTTLDMTPPVVSLTIAAPAASESSLQVTMTINEAGCAASAHRGRLGKVCRSSSGRGGP